MIMEMKREMQMKRELKRKLIIGMMMRERERQGSRE